MKQVKKISIIGAGHVGSTLAYILATHTPYRIALQDKDKDRAKGMLLDMFQASCVEGYFANIDVIASPKDLRDSHIVVVAAGSPRLPGMSRDDLLFKNAEVVAQVSREIKENAPNAIVILITNPLDAMVYVVLRETGFPRERVLGMAGVLDSARMAGFIYEKIQCASGQIVAPVMGGHGDNMVPLTRFASVNGIPLVGLLSPQDIEDITERTKNAGAEIVGYLKKGSAYFAPAQSAAQMVRAIASDSGKIFPCAVLLNGEYGYEDVVGGVPVELGIDGVTKVINLRLNDDEKQKFQRSIHSVQELIALLKKDFFKQS